MDQYQHCPACNEEYVAGIAACADCGGPLTPGPLQRYTAPATAGAQAVAATNDALDRLIARLPGQEAHLAVQALLMEKISCRVECAGLDRTYSPEAPPREPFAGTLPVEIYVAATHEEPAREVIESLDADLIGEQWNEQREAVGQATEEGLEPLPMADSDDQLAAEPPQPESTSLRTAVLIVLAALALLFLFGRR